MSRKKIVLDAVDKVLGVCFDVKSERDKEFSWVVPKRLQTLCIRIGNELKIDLGEEVKIVADSFFPNPINCIIQFDDENHLNQERARTFNFYPTGIPLNFDVAKYVADWRMGGNRCVVFKDVMTDLLAPINGLNPTVRIRSDEIGISVDEIEVNIHNLLRHRFAIHAGTTFNRMLETAGAKPHRTIGNR